MNLLLIRHPAVPLDIGFLGKSKVGKITDMSFPKGVPLGILSIAANLKSYGHEVHLYDALYDFDYKSYLNKKDIEFDKFLIGASNEKMIQKIEEINPDYIGISNQFTPLKDQAVRLAKLVKSINRKITVVIGGAHASSFPEDFEKEDCIDVIVGGRGKK